MILIVMTFETANNNNPICQYARTTDRNHNNGDTRSRRVGKRTSQNQNSDSTGTRCTGTPNSSFNVLRF